MNDSRLSTTTMRLIVSLAILLGVCMAIPTQAQNKSYPWLIGLGSHGPQMAIHDQNFINEYFQVKDWNVNLAAGQVKVYRHIGKGISIGTQLSIGQAARFQSSSKQFFLQWGMDLKYSFANGYILHDRCWFDPYLLIGGGLNKWGDVRGSFNSGIGVNFWILKHFGLYVQTAYQYMHAVASPNASDARPNFIHHSFGLVARIGHEADKDKDGIPDYKDKCPLDPGKKQFGGCPDTDGDSIIDKEDKCPTLRGSIHYMGCPDTDGDGVIDPDDACPTEKGPTETKGCPDKDGDGVADKDDKCPDQKGLPNSNGCPDTDGDGIADAEDKCPDQKGSLANGGCPDSDGDGLIDKDDKCPNIYGPKENNGCPKPALDMNQKNEVQRKLNFAARNIFFETGKEVLKKVSINDLDNVVRILQQYDFLKVSIDGHTDNVGDEHANLDLSTRRASVVMDYIVSKGIPSSRIDASGYGPYKPIADNKTPEGRAKNRRVEIKIRD